MLEPLVHATSIITDENDVGTYIDKAANLKAIITNDVVQLTASLNTNRLSVPRIHGAMRKRNATYKRINPKAFTPAAVVYSFHKMLHGKRKKIHQGRLFKPSGSLRIRTVPDS